MASHPVEKWHQFMKGELPGGLDELLDDNCVFLSPVVYTPQEGKEITKLYLQAAAGSFSGGDSKKVPGSSESKFKYVKEIVDGNHAVLEFETELDGKYMNGIDMITWNDEGKIIEFKVMMRPLQAINLIHEKMRAMLESLKK